MSEITEAKSKIKDLREVFISECKSGSWEKGVLCISNRYFRLTEEFKDKKSIWKVELDNRTTLRLEEISISKIYFLYLKFFINRSVRNSEKRRSLIQVGKVSDRFFEKNTELKRDNKLNKLLNE
jgi:hypothetical protein